MCASERHGSGVLELACGSVAQATAAASAEAQDRSNHYQPQRTERLRA